MLIAEQPAQANSFYAVMGTRCHVIVSGRETEGQLATVLIEADAAGTGVPERVHHRDDETFHILSGTVRFTLGNDIVTAGPGQTVFGARGIPHSWVALEPTRFVVSVTPAGLDDMFAEIDRLGEQATPERVADLCRAYAIEFTR